MRRIAFRLLVVILIVLALATISEKLFGTDLAINNIYHSWWFVVLWALLGFTSIMYIISQRLYRQRAAFLLHVAFAIILIGAFASFVFSERGYVHLRQGKPQNSFILDDEDLTKKSLPFDIKLVLFEVEYHPNSDDPTDFISFVRIDNEMNKVSLNKIISYKNYRLYQIDFDRDEMGSVLLVSHDPVGIAITYVGYFLLAISMMWLLYLRIGWKGVTVLLIIASCIWYCISQMNMTTPILRTPMLAMHVSVIVVAYLILLTIAITSLIAIVSSKKSLPIYRWNKKLLYAALFFLAAGIFIGAIWANISWGRYWGWDAKETWALITLLVYAIPMHRKSLPMFTNAFKFHLYCLIAFLSVLMTFLGVSFLLGGLHSYI